MNGKHFLVQQIGDNFVIDPTLEEESCSAVNLIMSVMPNGKVTSVVKQGYGSLLPTTLIKMLEVITIFKCFLIFIYIVKIANQTFALLILHFSIIYHVVNIPKSINICLNIPKSTNIYF